MMYRPYKAWLRVLCFIFKHDTKQVGVLEPGDSGFRIRKLCFRCGD